MSVLPNDPKFLERYKKLQRQQGVQKLYRQLEILEKRIDRGYKAFTSKVKRTLRKQWWIRDTLILDLETYYTVAADLLKLIEGFLPDADRKKLRADSTYKTIQKIRNWVIRHSYDKPGSDPYSGFSWSDKTGIALKGGTPFSSQLDPGFLVNSKNLADLLDSVLTDFSGRFPRSLIAKWYEDRHLI
jgi:hypothetical protein